VTFGSSPQRAGAVTLQLSNLKEVVVMELDDQDTKDGVAREAGAGNPEGTSCSIIYEAFAFSEPPCLTIEEDNCTYPQDCPLQSCMERFLESLAQKVRFIEERIETLNMDIADLEHELGKDIREAIEQHENTSRDL
jgi:hypothetical protein